MYLLMQDMDLNQKKIILQKCWSLFFKESESVPMGEAEFYNDFLSLSYIKNNKIMLLQL